MWLDIHHIADDHYEAWSGTLTRLRTIADELGEIGRRNSEDLRAELSRELGDPTTREAALERIAAAENLDVTALVGSRHVNGPPAELLAELATVPDVVEGLVMRLGRSPDSEVTVSFARRQRTTLRCYIAEDSTFSLAVSDLTKLLRSSEPGWSKIYRPRYGIPSFLVCVAISAWLLAGLAMRIAVPLDLAVMLGTSLACGAAAGVMILATKLWPRFEILDAQPGGSRGQRSAIFVSSILVMIIGGAVINLVV